MNNGGMNNDGMMNKVVFDKLLKFQEDFCNQKGIRTDIYYTAGKGALVVLEGHSLTVDNVIGVIPEIFITGFF